MKVGSCDVVMRVGVVFVAVVTTLIAMVISVVAMALVSVAIVGLVLDTLEVPFCFAEVVSLVFVKLVEE